MNRNLSLLSLLLLLILLITIIGLSLDVMAPDAALYGSISKTMTANNDFINLYALGNDWLDKPHLPFWLTAVSFKVFGVSNIAYKLPGVLLFFFGVWMTYRFTKDNYSKETAIIASVILLTSLHSVISNFDVRAEPFLTGLIIASLYWFYKFIKYRKTRHLIFGALFSALAIMTKGIFVLVPIIAAIGGEFIVKRQWRKILDYKWLIAIVLILLFITPELYTLYSQFDLHPEKTVFGKTQVSGIKFFFWDSQFGRFFNNAPIKGKGDIFFFLHTILWAFLPWAILFYIATFLKIKRNIKHVNKHEEFYSVFAALASIIVFSISQFQLAHYTNIVFPFMAIITADFIVKLKDQYSNFTKTYRISQWIVTCIGVILIPVLYVLLRPAVNYLFLIIVLISGIALYLNFKTPSKIKRLFYTTAIVFCAIYGFMFTHFYPTILNYQGDVAAAKYANQHYENEPVYILQNSGDLGFEYYINQTPLRITVKDLNYKKGSLVFVGPNELNVLKQQAIPFSIEKSFNHFRITKINGKFINHKTRSKSLKQKYLIRL